MEICLSEMGPIEIPTIHDWRLNEQHYGALEGLSKTKTAEKYGEEQVFIWRRSYEVSPPALDLNDKRHHDLINVIKSWDSISVLPLKA